MGKKEEKKFTIELNEHQLRILDMVCDRYSRLIEGQLGLSLQEICEEAWCNRHKTKEHPHGIGSEEFWDMRKKLENSLKQMEYEYWGLSGGQYNGIGYDKTADLLWEMHKSIEYAIWDNMEPKDKESMRWTVMSDGPMVLTGEPFIKVTKIKEPQSE